MENIKIFEVEYRFMRLVWDKEPINSTELTKLCRDEFGWKKSTTYTVIKRLSERGAIISKKAVVSSLVSRLQVQKYESERILEKTFDNSLPSFITAFLQDKKLTSDEAELLKKVIEEAAK